MVKVVLLTNNIGITKRKDRPHKYFCWRIQMEIVMTQRPKIQWCAEQFGGKVYEKTCT